MGVAARLSIELVAELSRLREGLDRAIGMVDGAGTRMGAAAEAGGRRTANGFMRAALGATVAVTALVAVGAAAAAGASAFLLFQNAAGRTQGHEAFAKSLGMTAEQIKRAGGAATTFGDVLKGLWQTIEDQPGVSEFFQSARDWAVKAMGNILDYSKMAAAGVYAYFKGGFENIKMLWDRFPAVMGDAFIAGVNIAISAIEKLTNAGIDSLNTLIGQTNIITRMASASGLLKIPEVTLGRMDNPNAGAREKFSKDSQANLQRKYQDAMDWMDDFGSKLGANTDQATRDRLAAGAKNKKGREDKSAEKREAALQREEAAIREAIRGLQDLAVAYGVSDAAALRALATTKAREKAIRKQADVERFVALELSRNVAERVMNAAKSAADLRHEAKAQDTVNAAVRSGSLQIERMNDALKELTAQRDLLAAIDVAKDLGDHAMISAAEKALADLTNAQQDNNRARRETQDLQATAAMRREIQEMEAITAATEQYGRARQDIILFMDDGFGQEQALARANAEHQKQLILIRAQTAADQARRDGLVGLIDAINEKAAADIAAIESDLGLQTAEEAFMRLRDAADGLDFAGIFGRGGQAVRGMVDAMDDLRDAQAAHRALVQEAGGDANKIARADALYQNAKVAATMKQIGAAKSLFKENSAGYRAMAAAEKAYAMVQLANTAVNVAAGAAKMFASLGPWGFAAVGAMVAVMAGLGFRGGKGSASAPPVSAEELQAKFGTGTVYGNSGAQSESLSKALDILSANSNSDLEYSNQMLRTLRSIDGGIGQLAGKLGAQIGLGAAGMFDTTKLKIGSSGSSGILGMFGSSTTRSLYDQGIQIYSQSIDAVLAGQFNAQVYNVIQQVKKKSGVFGIGGSTKTSYSTTTNAINQDVKLAFADIIRNVSDGVVGVMAEYDLQLAAQLRTSMLAFKLPEIKFSTSGMNGEEIEKALQAYFGSVADQLSGLAARQLPVLNELQKNGEGMFETLARVIKTFGSVNIGLSTLGMGGFGSSEAGLRNAAQLTDLFGDLDGFQEATSKYADKFLSEAERMAPIAAAVREEMARLGMAGVATNDQFKAMVSGLNLSTEAGRETFAALMAVAPAFAKVTDYLGDLNNTLGESAEIAKKRRDLEIQIMELQGRSAEALAAKREKELLALEETLRPLQLYIYALQDEATAKAQLKTAYDRESKDIISLRDRYQDASKSLREFRDTLGDQVNTASAYARAEQAFAANAAAARIGDLDALGRMQAVSQELLTQSRDNASSQLDYLRDAARVKQALDDAIGAADEAVDYQQAQLDALTSLVSSHIDLNENILSVRDAILAVEAARTNDIAIRANVGPIPQVQTQNAAANTQENAALRAEIQQLNAKIDRMIAAEERTANAAERTNRDFLQPWSDGDAAKVRMA